MTGSRSPWAAAALAALCLTGLPPARTAAQAAGDPPPAEAGAPLEGSAAWFEQQGKIAVEASAYETAVRRFTEGKLRYPDDPRFDLALADLYWSRELWSLALDAYLAAEGKGADDLSTLTRIARGYGKLNRERESIAWLETALARYPGDPEAIDDLAWMCFKTHRLARAEQALLDGVARHGMTADFAMTLGTVYSGMADYDHSSRHYRMAIERAERSGDRTFAAIAWYNLSLLEHRFFRWNSALRSAERSLAEEDRPSGRLARGELLESRLDVRGARAEYEQAASRDDTPLAKLNLAGLLATVGELDLALAYAEQAREAKDLSWLLYYGSDPDRYHEDVEEVLADIHEAIARRELARPTAGLRDRIAALAQAARSAALGLYHRQRFRLLAVRVGQAFLAEGWEEDGAYQIARATRAFPPIALKYLAVARSIETRHSPLAEPSYVLEEGVIRRAPALLQEAIDRLDPLWERRSMAEALVELARLLPRRSAARREAVLRLFAVNPGALVQNHLGLPLALSFTGAWSDRERRLVARYLRRAGSELETAPDSGFRHRLVLARDADGLRFALEDTEQARVVAHGSSSSSGSDRRRCAALVADFLAEAYAVR